MQRRGGTVQLSKGVPLTLGDRIRHLPGAGQVIGGLMDMVAFEDHDLYMVIVNGWEPDCPVLDFVKTIAGRRLRRRYGPRHARPHPRRQSGQAAGRHGGNLLAALPGCRHFRELQRLRERRDLHVARRLAAANGPPRPGDRFHRASQPAGRRGGDGRAGPPHRSARPAGRGGSVHRVCLIAEPDARLTGPRGSSRRSPV